MKENNTCSPTLLKLLPLQWKVRCKLIVDIHIHQQTYKINKLPLFIKQYFVRGFIIMLYNTICICDSFIILNRNIMLLCFFLQYYEDHLQMHSKK